MEGLFQPSAQRRKIHPHKFALWIAMGSIAMMFAGLTSAYIVREAQGDWRYYKLPSVFWWSTAAIVLSSVTMFLGVRAFRNRRMPAYRLLVTATLLLGLVFGACQSYGFYQLYHQPQPLVVVGPSSDTGATELIEKGDKLAPVMVSNSNPSEAFLFIIAGLHLLHIAGGIVALLIVFLMAYRKRVKVYNTTGLEIVASYWHFVDVLWIYLFIFFLANQ